MHNFNVDSCLGCHTLPSRMQQTHLVLRHGFFAAQTHAHVFRWHYAYSSVGEILQTISFGGGGKQVWVRMVRLLTPKETPSAIPGPTFWITLSYSVLCATLHLALFTGNWGGKKKGRGKEDTKLLLSSRMTGYNSSNTWQATDTRGKVKMLQGCTNAWRYFSCR